MFPSHRWHVLATLQGRPATPIPLVRCGGPLRLTLAILHDLNIPEYHTSQDIKALTVMQDSLHILRSLKAAGADVAVAARTG